MHGPGALHAGLLIRTLLQHYCQQQPVSLIWLRKPEQSGSLVLGLASIIHSLLFVSLFRFIFLFVSLSLKAVYGD